MSKVRIPLWWALLGALMAASGAALAQDLPITNWLTDPASTLALDIRQNFWTTFLLILPFLLLPQILLLIIIFKYRASRGHEAAKWHENVRLEILWTVIPVITLILVAIPTYATLQKMDVPPKSDLVVEVIGHQFFWEYRYPRYGVAFSDEPLVVPADKVVTINTTSVDVIHSWWVPAFGVKQDANPGKITHAWFKARAGRYKGQCAELCGTLHAEMLIDVTVLPEAEFDTWVRERQIQNPVDAVGDSTAPAAEQLPDSIQTAKTEGK